MDFEIYSDKRIFVCIKSPGFLSTDEPGGMPEHIRTHLGDSKACVRTVHRLDRVVGGVMVFARSAKASQILSEQIASRRFEKKYLAVCHGAPTEPQGTFEDLLARDKAQRMTYVTDTPGKDARPAVLDYCVLDTKDNLSLIEVTLHTGRTHQIRVQFSSRNLPLYGDKKYGTDDGGENIALWSYHLGFAHPESDEFMSFTVLPDKTAYPWSLFEDNFIKLK